MYITTDKRIITFMQITFSNWSEKSKAHFRQLRGFELGLFFDLRDWWEKGAARMNTVENANYEEASWKVARCTEHFCIWGPRHEWSAIAIWSKDRRTIAIAKFNDRDRKNAIAIFLASFQQSTFCRSNISKMPELKEWKFRKKKHWLH